MSGVLSPFNIDLESFEIFMLEILHGCFGICVIFVVNESIFSLWFDDARAFWFEDVAQLGIGDLV